MKTLKRVLSIGYFQTYDRDSCQEKGQPGSLELLLLHRTIKPKTRQNTNTISHCLNCFFRLLWETAKGLQSRASAQPRESHLHDGSGRESLWPFSTLPPVQRSWSRPGGSPVPRLLLCPSWRAQSESYLKILVHICSDLSR